VLIYVLADAPWHNYDVGSLQYAWRPADTSEVGTYQLRKGAAIFVNMQSSLSFM
jgi:hypothetical protein